MCRSVPQIPVRRTRTITSSWPVSGSGTEARTSPGSGRGLTSARMDDGYHRERRNTGYIPVFRMVPLVVARDPLGRPLVDRVGNHRPGDARPGPEVEVGARDHDMALADVERDDVREPAQSVRPG